MVCCDRPPLKSVGTHAQILAIPSTLCNHKHVMRQLIPQVNLPDNFRCGGFYGCIKNEIISLHERHIQQVPDWKLKSGFLWDLGFTLLREDFPPRRRVKLTREECIAQASECRRNRMRNAYHNIDINGWSDRYARGKSFVKFEEFECTEDLDQKACRMIQHRSDEYCYILARYMKVIEKSTLYKRRCNQRIFMKGLTPRQKAKTLRNAAESFRNPVFICLDHSRYDAHLVEQIKARVREYYKEFFPGDDKFSHLLHMQKNNRVTSSNGVKYKVTGTLLSGDYNTSLEGNLVNYAALKVVFQDVNAEYLVDGDDSVVVCDATCLTSVHFDLLKEMCLTTKVDIHYSIYDADFCQCQYIETVEGPLFVRNPFRVMSRTCYTEKTYDNRTTYSRLLKAVGMCEFTCNRGVPVLQSYADMLVRSAGPVEQLHGELSLMLAKRGVSLNNKALPISQEARLSFELAFGIPLHQQLELEAVFNTTELELLLLPSRDFNS
jgi:hypothetical protein